MGLNQNYIQTTSRPFASGAFEMFHTISPASGYFGINWPTQGAIPTSFSSAEWSSQAKDIPQQTFLGASIRGFTLNGGFGDNSSTLTVELVNDEFNKSDRTIFGFGDDVYHNGIADNFIPPPVGSPVFFKFGPTFATVEQVYRHRFNSFTQTTTTPAPTNTGAGSYNPDTFTSLANNIKVNLKTNSFESASPEIEQYIGNEHLSFGGILQSFSSHGGSDGSPLFSAQITDPREILSNVVVILNNYAGTVYQSNNLLNVYGFLEHNASIQTYQQLKMLLPLEYPLKKYIALNGQTWYQYEDLYSNVPLPITFPSFQSLKVFPMTGTGFSRRGNQGIPYFKIKHSINALMGYYIDLPQEYVNMGYGGAINFRGHKYVIDFGSLPELPSFYCFDYDQINLLDLFMEICDITSKELFVTLLPVVNHPHCQNIYNFNSRMFMQGLPQNAIAGIIRIEAIDRSMQQSYGVIKNHIETLQASGVFVESKDIGFELANVTTEKFVVGAQEVDTYFFSGSHDRISSEVDQSKPLGYEWSLNASLEQQILPYYGKLGNNAVTIPKGFGAYQQILLDASSLNANGVGSYYVATEMELRCALISFDRWKEFLQMYNDIYMESLEADDAMEIAALQGASPGADFPPLDDISNNYAVTVPRSLFISYAPQPFGPDKLPASPCNPPYGYPLYYKRMTKIGIPEGGLTELSTKQSTILTILASLRSINKSNFKAIINSALTQIRSLVSNSTLTEFEKTYFNTLETTLNSVTPANLATAVAFVDDSISNLKAPLMSTDLSIIAKKNTENAMKVYNFVKNVAEECLGKKFLVKIPQKVNLRHSNTVTMENGPLFRYTSGPFGFKPRPYGSNIGYEYNPLFISAFQSDYVGSFNSFITSFCSSGISVNAAKYNGALRGNYNPVTDVHEFNYVPNNDGGFCPFDLMPNNLSFTNLVNLKDSGTFLSIPKGLQQTLIPMDITNFLSNNGRLSPYVRFNNSQHLSFDGISSSEFTQQVATANGMIPDIAEQLDNVGSVNDRFSFPNTINSVEPRETLKSIGFVKCSVDEKLYMPPRIINRLTNAYAQAPIAVKKFVMPRKIYRQCEDRYVDSFSFYYTHYIPTDAIGGQVQIIDFDTIQESVNYVISGAGFGGLSVATQNENLDTQHVYALITLPGRVIPTKDARFRDGPFQSSNAEKFKHFMTMDVVKNAPGFQLPAHVIKPTKNVLRTFNCEQIPSDVRIKAWAAAKKANDSLLSFGFPQRVSATMPSPVYPDLVALPLLSKERCYGPWVSSHLDLQAKVYTNIGGRVEFIKDENLAPWNYAGYDLMHQAGRTQAEFANSIMLASERGGFVMAKLPDGRKNIGNLLADNGPLITSIQVNMSDGGIKTTYQFDLYTSSFGKLQKQKQDQISQIGRERQKLRDERNALIRKNIGKNQTKMNYLDQYKDLNRGLNYYDNSSIDSGPSSAITTIAITANKSVDRRWSSDSTFGDNGVHSVLTYRNDGSILRNGAVGEVMQKYINEDGLAQSYMNSAAANITDIFAPASKEESHPNMSAQPNPFSVSKQTLYFDENSPFDLSDFN